MRIAQVTLKNKKDLVTNVWSNHQYMSAKDIFHNVVIESLKKENWDITHDPLYINQGLVKLYIDLGAERVITAEKGIEKIIAWIK